MDDQYEWKRIEDATLVDERSMQPHEIRIVKCREKKFVLVRLEEHHHLLDARCPHAGGNLAEGWCTDDGKLVCPVHRIEFDVESGRSHHIDRYAVNSHRVEVRDDGFYAAFPKKKWFEFW